MDIIRKLTVIKRPRLKPLLDIPINFPALKNLHLELMEIKDKLKKNLPLIPISKPTLHIKEKSSSSEENQKPGPIVQPPPGDTIKEKHKEKREHKEKKHRRDRDKPKKEKSLKKSSKKSHKKHDPVVADLGESSESSSESETEEDESSSSVTDATASGSSATKGGDGSDAASSGGSGTAEEKEEGEEPDEYDPYAGLSPEEREAKEKEEYIWRFRILKKQYGRNASIPIPEWNEHSDLNLMKNSYERTIRELYLDDAVETYRTYLIGGWMVMEYVCTQLLFIDLRGFTRQQTQMMYKYDRMLIELGEKSYTRWGMNLPVEIRLLGLILFQAGIFYLGKVLVDNYGPSAAEMFRGFTGQPPAEEPSAQPPSDAATPPKSKMRGPKISADDIRNKNAG